MLLHFITSKFVVQFFPPLPIDPTVASSSATSVVLRILDQEANLYRGRYTIVAERSSGKARRLPSISRLTEVARIREDDLSITAR